VVADRVLELRRPLAGLRHQSAVWAGFLLLGAFVAYSAAFLGAAFLDSIWLRCLCALALGPLIAVPFRIAHDAGHGCHFSRPRLDRMTCRLSLLPSYHPCSVWILLHNLRHHAFTNLRDRDYIWIPLSEAEYDNLGPLGRTRERFYRTTLGTGVYYLVAVWWGMITLRRSLIGKARRVYFTDRLVVLVFFGAQLTLLSAGGPDAAEFALRVSLAIVVPFLIFNWLVGFASFLNHTHPQVPWFAKREEWSFYTGQVNCTVHMAMPTWMIFFLTDVGLHGAHHIEPRIPIWGLEEAETHIVADAHADLVLEQWSWSKHRAIMQGCKLYDYDAHRWLDFAGRPTGPVTFAGMQRAVVPLTPASA
jgi:omega-6 fatty acid desaturase (delta-12 desaturase)